MTIKELHEKMKADPELAKAYLEYFKEVDDPKIKALTRELADKLNALEMETAKGFAEKNGFTLEADAETDKVMSTINRSMCDQFDKIIKEQMEKGNK